MFGKNGHSGDTSKTRKPRKARTAPRMITEGDKKARAHMFMADHMNGLTVNDVAAKYDCSPTTVNRSLDYARAHGLYLDRARQLIEENLLPRALAVYELYLEGGSTSVQEKADDLAAARDILFGLGALSKSTTIKHTPSDVAETLDAWRDTYFKEKATTHAVVVEVQSATPALPEVVVEDDED